MKGYFLAVWVPERPWGVARSQAREQEFQAWMLQELEQVSDRCQPLPPDRWLLDLHGMESCLGPAPGIAQKLERRLREQGVAPRLGLAATRTAALLAAFAGTGPSAATPRAPLMLAPGWGPQAPARRCAAAGVRLMLDDAPAAALAGLALATLEAMPDYEEAAACLEVFRRWGLRTLGEVAALPPRALRERLGRAGLACQRWARGDDEGLLLAAAAAAEPARCEQTFEPALEGYLPLLPWLDQTVRAEAAGWERHDRALAACELVLGLESCTGAGTRAGRVWQWRYAPALPHRDARRCLRQLETALAMRPPAAPIATAKIEFRLLRPRRMQAGLFGDAAVEEENRERLLGRLRVLLEDPEGQRCGSPRLRDLHRRDVFAMVPFSGQPSAVSHPPSDAGDRTAAVCGRSEAPAKVALALRARRPAPAIRMEMAPLPVREEGVHPLGAVCHLPQSAPRRVQRAWGPWRCSGAWWTDTAWSRDEWDVEFAGGERGRLLYDRRRRQWFLLGEYD